MTPDSAPRRRRRALAGLAAVATAGGLLAAGSSAQAQETTDDWKYDFGPAGQTVAEGYAGVDRGTAYSAEAGHGFTTDMTPSLDRDRGAEDDPVGRDFIAWFGGEYTFAVDVPNGNYTAAVTVGDYIGSAESDFAFEGRAHGSISPGSESVNTEEFAGVFVEDGRLDMTVSGRTGHLNGLELTRVGDVPDGNDEPDEPCEDCAAAVESIDRAPVAVSVDDGVYLSWRAFASDPEGTAFNVYRDGEPITDEPTEATNLTDEAGTVDSTYWIATVADGAETGYTDAVDVWSDQYVDIDMNRPEGGTTESGDYTYQPNDATVADLDGDGTYELIQKWDPTNSQDNSRSGHTGNVYIDAYTLDGEQLWRIDLGVNIRAGAHYTSLSAYDFDGDGKAELALKTGDGSVDGEGTVIGDPEADHRNDGGYILTGPEYLTVFDGETGAALDTVDYQPDRGDICDWGDCYGNRGDRMMAAVAYLDGDSPSLVTSRGIYTKSELSAWDWDGESLTRRWHFLSTDFGPQYTGQGNHQLSIADVDLDGRDEIVYGAMTLNDDGTPLYSSELGHGDALHVSDLDPSDEGQEIFSPFECMGCSGGIGAALRDGETGEVIWSMPGDSDIGRGTCGDIDPDHAGAECWAVSADGSWDSKEGELRAADGTLISNSIPSANHMVWWDGDLGREILDHEFNEPDYVPIYPYIAEWDHESDSQEEIFTPEGVHTNNGTKGNPVLTADLFGDWREEVLLRKESNDGVRLYTTAIETEHSIPTLMHDPQYRLAIAWQNESYNQPPWPSFFVGWDMDEPEWKPVTGDEPRDEAEAPYAFGSCQVDYIVPSDRGKGFTARLEVTNTGDTTIEDWNLVWKGSGVDAVDVSWGASIEASDGTLTADPHFWGDSIRPGKTRQIGFRGTGDPDDPGMFLMNGRICTAA
ncbi:rhamnogalacturonan lyase family protein [Glycomyces xiaoerkulensis]|uniref:rhamnogalacturonan lyase family protein n=1 Tax=Glycomyces xiaoerkulensis TaxID=2038139 RepID=UPI000C26BD9D|nr:cellulose binding domain-containing protein [Glycomyces xiaoerkulensis]